MFIFISRLLFLMIFWSEFGCLGVQKQAFGMDGIAKNNFRRNWISYNSRFDFSSFWVALGPIFMAFVVLETGLKIDGFSGVPGGAPELRQCTSETWSTGNGITHDPPQPGGPHKGGRRIYMYIYIYIYIYLIPE